MPGALIERDILNQLTIATYQYVAGYLQLVYLPEIGVGIGIEAIHKKILDPGTAELPWWQTDTMYHQ